MLATQTRRRRGPGRFHRWLALSAPLLLLAAPARAGDYARTGFYAGVGGSYVVDLYEDEASDAIDGVDANIDSSFGVNARLGVRFLKVLALEAQYEWVDEYDVDLSIDGFGDLGTLQIEQHTLTANLKLYAPIWRIQPYLVAGAGIQHAELNARLAPSLPGGPFRINDKDTILAGRAGAGLEIYLTDHIVVFGEGSVVLTDEDIDIPDIPGLSTSNISNIFYVAGQAGLMWRF